MRVWGFTYRTHMVWDKEIIGMGYWFRMQHELLLVGKKGNFSPPEQSARISSVYRERRGEHSAKPLKIRQLIERWYPNCTKLEMFARPYSDLFPTYSFENWDTWGNEL